MLLAYVDSSVMFYVILAIFGVAIVLGTAFGIYGRKAKKCDGDGSEGPVCGQVNSPQAIDSRISRKIANTAILCAFMVVIIHCRPHMIEYGVGWWARMLVENGFCAVAVPFFFTVSGFFLAGHVYDEGWQKQELFKRIRTLVVPFFIWTVLFFFYSEVVSLIKTGGWMPEQNVCYRKFMGISLTACPILSPLWYVRGLLVLIVISPLLKRFLRFGGRGLIVLFVFCGAICPGEDTGEGWVWGITRYGIMPLAGVFYFSLGMAMRLGVLRVKFSKWGCIGALLTGLALCAVRAIFLRLDLPLAQYWVWMAIPLLMYGLFGLVPARQWPLFLTANAFPVYLIHKFAFPFVEKTMLHEVTVWRYGLVAVVIFAASVGVAIALKWACPRVSAVLFGGR